MAQEHHPKEEALLRAEMIVDWKRKRGVYNFRQLPRTAIIALTHQVFGGQLRLLSRNIKGINGRITAEGDYLYCSGFGSGAPALVTLMEELRALGVSEFIFIGLCASLVPERKPGTLFYVDKAWSASGITASYVADTLIGPYDPGYVKDLVTGLGLQGAVCCSTDSPFRETRSFLQQARQQGCELIEMECAAAYAFAHFYRINVACYLVVADQITDAWIPPAQMAQLLEAQQQLVEHIVKRRS